MKSFLINNAAAIYFTLRNFSENIFYIIALDYYLGYIPLVHSPGND